MNGRKNLLIRNFGMWALAAVFSSGALAFAQEDQSQATIEADVYGTPDVHVSGTYDRSSNPDQATEEQGQYDQEATQNTVPEDQTDRNDPPGRAARLQYMTGSVSIQPRGTEDWVQGSLNRPLTIADNIWADKNARAELNVGTGLIRIGSETSLTLTNVSDSSVQLSLHQGAMNLHVRHLYRGEIYEVDTPNQAFTILKTGDYRFDVNPNSDTTYITVWRGEGESTGQGPSVKIKEHQQARFRGGNSLAHEIARAPREDGFDEWCRIRNRRIDESVSARYVSPDVIGSEDLDAYGTWRHTPRYGAVWVPTVVDAGWAPYSTGHWAYIEPWGWTWVDDAPWGFAPFHYGRWIHEEGYWGWAPGPYYGGWDRGWYAPALVAWFGGPSWGVSLGFGGGGGYGWCALGWGEPFIPWYRSGWGYFRNVNVYNTNIVNINNYRNVYVNNTYNNYGGGGKPPYGGGGYGNGGGGKPPYGGGGYGNGKPPYGGRGYGNVAGKTPPSGTGLHYANINVRGGFNAVSRGVLERGLPVRQNAVQVSANEARNAPLAGRINVNPTVQNRLGPNAGRPAAAAPTSAITRPTISRMNPPAASLARTQPAPNVSNRPFSAGKPSAGIPAQSTRAENPSLSGNVGRNVPPSPQASGRINNGAGATNPSNVYGRGGLSGSVNNAGLNSPTGRSVPRPPSAGGTSMRAEPMRTATNQSYPAASRSYPSSSPSGSSVGAAGGRNVPRPPANYSQGGSSYSSRGIATSQPATGYGSRSAAGSYSSSPRNGVPRPSGQVAPAPRSYSGAASPSYSRSYPSAGSSPSYSRSYPQGSYSRAPYNAGTARSSSAPQYSSPRSQTYGGRTYGGGQSSSPQSSRSYGGGSYGGSRGGGYSSPSRASAPASSGRSTSGGGSSQGTSRSGGRR